MREVELERSYRWIVLPVEFSGIYVNPRFKYWTAKIIGFHHRYNLAREFLSKTFKEPLGYKIGEVLPDEKIEWLIEVDDYLEEAGGTCRDQYRAYVQVTDLTEERVTVEEIKAQDVMDWAVEVGEVEPSVRSKIARFQVLGPFLPTRPSPF